MSLFADFSHQYFLEHYWQEQPILSANAFDGLIDSIDGDTLAGLACDEAVESRIICGDNMQGEWTCRNGPFQESDFSEVPSSHWTLLVQGLDLWDSQFKQLLDQFSFIPRWRIEDIMASYAPMGGGVGPHFDYYDVFLIQISGERRWQLGQWCDETSEQQDNDQVKLLSEFHATDSHVAKPGDMLYVPAGLAHWGVAVSNDCITLSVGFRAPSEKQLVAELLENVVEGLSEHNRYKDEVAAIDKDPHKINEHVHKKLDGWLNTLSYAHLQSLLYRSFGQLVTEPRYLGFEDELQSVSNEQLTAFLANHDKNLPGDAVPVEHLSHSRLAYSDTHLFANGDAFESDVTFSQALCNKRLSSDISSEQKSLVLELIERGVISIVGLT